MESYHLILLLSLLGEVDISLTYNVEVLEHRRFSTEVSSFFGYKVVQFNSSNGERILIGDPSSNKLHVCDAISEKCDNITLPNMDRTLHLGLTLEVEPVSSRCLVCGTDKPHDCSKTLYTNGACYTVDSSLTVSAKRTPGYQVCQKVAVDLCFLFDDSFSMGTLEFASVKNFLLKTILNLKNSTVHFAVVQYGSDAQKIFDFNDYQLGEGENRIEKMEQKGGRTNTYKAINFTLNKIFNPEAGVRHQAKRILLLLTDGEANDVNDGVTEAADKQKVTRYIIGVGKNFILESNTELASNPPEHHIHVMQDYSNLEGFFKELQTKILAIEGVAQGSNFSREMSSAALSAALTQDREILGDPGIFDWSGAILEQEQLVYMSPKEEDRNGYLGYSVKLLHTGKGLLCVVGSPRYQYVGLVTVLQEVAGERKWEKIDSLLGEQVGSYFGAEIAVSDLDQDGMTDVVLISAPHHYEAKWSGQVSVCLFTEQKLECTVTLHGEPGHLQSQFGATVSSLGDLDGDGFTEVAVGAPYEMDGKGALYIYNGEPAGLSAAYSQRLLSPPGVLGFGLSIHGVLDMTEDGLIDVVVGSRGHVTLHRSQPLLKVSMSVTSNQTYMVVASLKASDCDSKLTLEACVQAEILTPKYTDPLSISIQYSLILDFARPESRILFTNKQREMNGTVAIWGPGPQCQNYTVFLQECGVEDLSEVHVSLTAFPMQIHAPWILSPYSSLGATNLISLQMCEGESCELDMSIKVTHSPLVVQDGASFSMFLSLHNMDMKAHQTRLTVGVPDGLSFRKANVTEASYRISLVCGDFKEQILMCNVSHPSLKRGVWAVIQIMFSIVSNVSWADRILLAVNVTSHENKTSSGAEYKVPVLYPIHIIVWSLEDSTKHVPFHSLDSRATAVHRYQIQSFGLHEAPITLSVSVSSYADQIEDVSWDFFIFFSQNSNVNCSEFSDSSANQTQRKIIETTTKTRHCIMNTSGEINLNITGPLRPMNAWKKEGSVSVRSAVMIQYDGLRFYSDMGSTFHNAQVVTQVELLVSPDHTLYIVGGTVGGLMAMVLLSFLLYKCGFFKRYKDRMMEGIPLHGDHQLLAAPEGEVTEAAAQLMGPQES